MNQIWNLEKKRVWTIQHNNECVFQKKYKIWYSSLIKFRPLNMHKHFPIRGISLISDMEFKRHFPLNNALCIKGMNYGRLIYLIKANIFRYSCKCKVSCHLCTHVGNVNIGSFWDFFSCLKPASFSSQSNPLGMCRSSLSRVRGHPLQKHPYRFAHKQDIILALFLKCNSTFKIKKDIF